MQSISIVIDYNLIELKSDLLKDLAVTLDNELCAKGLTCSLTFDLIDCSLRLTTSLISGEEFTYQFFVDVVSLVEDIFDKKNIFLKVESVSVF